MSYRTRINGVQVFGNNECYEKWINFIKTKGIEVDEEYCYDGKITDVMGAISVIEEIVMDMENEEYRTNSVFDLSFMKDKITHENSNAKSCLLDELIQHIECGYVFMPYAFLQACKDVLEMDHFHADKKHFNCYKLKKGKSIHIKAS